MDYYRSNIAGGIVPSNANDTNSTVLNSASDSYASNYWNVPYSDGLSPMKQIEGKNGLEKKMHYQENGRCRNLSMISPTLN